MGGEQPAHDFIRRAIANGKHAATANTEVRAKNGPSIVADAAGPKPDHTGMLGVIVCVRSAYFARLSAWS